MMLCHYSKYMVYSEALCGTVKYDFVVCDCCIRIYIPISIYILFITIIYYLFVYIFSFFSVKNQVNIMSGSTWKYYTVPGQGRQRASIKSKRSPPRLFTIPGLTNAAIDLQLTIEDTKYCYSSSKAPTNKGQEKMTATSATIDDWLCQWRQTEVGHIDNIKKDMDLLRLYSLKLKLILIQYDGTASDVDEYCKTKLFDATNSKFHETKMVIFKQIWAKVVKIVETWKKELDAFKEEHDQEVAQLTSKIYALQKNLTQSEEEADIATAEGEIVPGFITPGADIIHTTNSDPGCAVNNNDVSSNKNPGNSVGLVLPDGAATIRWGYDCVDVGVCHVIQESKEYDEDDIAPLKAPIPLSIDIDLMNQTPEKDKQQHTNAELDDNLSLSHVFICRSPVSPAGKNINIFESVSVMSPMENIIASDDIELDSTANLAVQSPFSPITPVPISDGDGYDELGSFEEEVKSVDTEQPRKQWRILSPLLKPIKECDDEIDSIYLTEKHLIQQNRKFKTWLHKNGYVYFDKCIYCEDSDKMAMISRNGFSSGICEWMIEIIHCDVHQQEIGVIGCNADQEVDIDEAGIKGTDEFGARAVYGSELLTDSIYYGSWNADGKQRSYRNLKDQYRIGWCSGDSIKVCLDLNSWRIKFWLNGARVGKSLSLQPGQTYFPVIGFNGNCLYNIVSLF